ncbi:MAG TPA: hypothetical protein VIL63_08345 [Terriglobales bacterium]
MKIGADNRIKMMAAAGLGLLALVLVGKGFIPMLGGGSAAVTTSAAVPASTGGTTSAPDFSNLNDAAPSKAARGPVVKKRAVQTIDPTLRNDLLKISEDTKYEGTGRNIFRVFVEIPKIITPPITPQRQADTGPAPPPPPPPINLRFYGFATSRPDGGKRIFLSQGEDVFIASEGDIVDRRYKVVRISANAVEILDVLSNNRQSIPLTQG